MYFSPCECLFGLHDAYFGFFCFFGLPLKHWIGLRVLTDMLVLLLILGKLSVSWMEGLVLLLRIKFIIRLGARNVLIPTGQIDKDF